MTDQSRPSESIDPWSELSPSELEVTELTNTAPPSPQARAETKRALRFNARAEPAHDGLAVIYDLSDFTSFFNQPDANRYVPKFLNRVAEAITLIIEGGNQFWIKEDKAARSPILLELEHRKFLGDGELLIFRVDESKIRQIFNLLIGFWNLQNGFNNFLREIQQDIPVAAMPPAIKFGIARGDIYELTQADTEAPSEFIGVSINLASRLVKYCPHFSFIASTRVELDQQRIKNGDFIRVVATQIRGFKREIVIVDRNEFKALPAEFGGLFENLV